ncbi:MAG: hypothetical protein K0R15_2400 [Clostridiales bacterium]|jgi:hypothetical protein|nr:hypothetical protein [Clostridiales bacterium]
MKKPHIFVRYDILMLYVFSIVLTIPISAFCFNDLNDIKIKITLVILNFLFIIFILTFFRLIMFLFYFNIMDNGKEFGMIKNVFLVDLVLLISSIIVYIGALIIYTSLDNKYIFLFSICSFLYSMNICISTLHRHSIYIGEHFIIYSSFKININDIESVDIENKQNENVNYLKLNLKDKIDITIYGNNYNLNKAIDMLNEYIL